MKVLNVAAAVLAGGAACTSQNHFEVATETVQPASKIDWLGAESALLGDGHLKVGEPLPAFQLTNEQMKSEAIAADGRVKLISVVPSLDTEVCDRQTHDLAQARGLHASVVRITVSRDLPYSQGRYAESNDLKSLRYLSDYKSREFGRRLGLEIAKNDLLARAIIVVDGRNVVRYFQITPKIYTLPDMVKAFAAANAL